MFDEPPVPGGRGVVPGPGQPPDQQGGGGGGGVAGHARLPPPRDEGPPPGRIQVEVIPV